MTYVYWVVMTFACAAYNLGGFYETKTGEMYFPAMIGDSQKAHHYYDSIVTKYDTTDTAIPICPDKKILTIKLDSVLKCD